MAYLFAALGGALGALARWGLAAALPAAPGGWPWSTLLVNLSGCLAIGVVLAVLPVRFPDATWLRPFLAVGLIGGYTTWSAFALDVVRLASTGHPLVALGYVAVSVVGGVAAVVTGILAGRAVVGPAVPVHDELAAGEDRT